MSFENMVKSWVSIDNKLKILSEETKSLREQRNEINSRIIKHVDTSGMKSATVRISDGRLRFVDSSSSAPLTLKFVQSCLQQCLSSEKQVEQIMTYIKEQRETKIKTEVKRYYE